MTFPQAIPEIPVQSVDQAINYYVNTLGFTLDWGDELGGIAGISKGDCRLYLTNGSVRAMHSNSSPTVAWINLESKNDVDALHANWKGAGAANITNPEDKTWQLREFSVSDLNGNAFRVFYDFSRD